MNYDPNIQFNVSGSPVLNGLVRGLYDKLEGYKDRVNINVKDFGAIGDGVTDDSPAIQKILDRAPAEGITLIFPDGVYRIKKYLVVYANTHIVMSPRTVLLRGHGGGFFKNGKTGDMYKGYEGNGNIHIEGGTLDGNVLEFPFGFNHTGWCHATNLSFTNITFKDVITNHFMDINACKDVLIDNCRFLGYRDGTTDQSRGFAEAIQLSQHTLLGYSDFGEFDGLPCINVTVRNCYFGSSGTTGMGPVATGVGNHGAVHDIYCQNITVDNCVFDGMTYSGVRNFKFKDMTVSNCQFNNCMRGVSFSNADGIGLSSTDVNGVQTGRPQSGSNMSIKGCTFKNTKKEHIYIAGWEKDGIVAKVDSIMVTDNNFESQNTDNSSAVYLSFVHNANFVNNIFKSTHRVFYVNNVSSLFIDNNKSYDTVNEFVYVNVIEEKYRDKYFNADISVRQNYIENTGKSAIIIQYTKQFSVESNYIRHAAIEVDNVRSAILSGNQSLDGKVMHNTVTPDPLGNQHKYGVEITQTCKNVQVFNNNAMGKTGNTFIGTGAGIDGYYMVSPNGSRYVVTITNDGKPVTSAG